MLIILNVEPKITECQSDYYVKSLEPVSCGSRLVIARKSLKASVNIKGGNISGIKKTLIIVWENNYIFSIKLTYLADSFTAINLRNRNYKKPWWTFSQLKTSLSASSERRNYRRHKVETGHVGIIGTSV